MSVVATVRDVGATFAAFAFDRIRVTDVHGGELLEVDAITNQVISTSSIGDLPAWISATNRSLWVTIQRPPAVVKVDPANPAATTTVSLPTRIVAMTAAPDSIWLATNDAATGTSAIYRVDAATNEVELFDSLGSKAFADLAVDDRTLWGLTHLDAELVRARF